MLIVIIAGVIGLLYGWYLWFLFDYCLRPEVRERARRRREEEYHRRMSNPKYAKKFKP